MLDFDRGTSIRILCETAAIERMGTLYRVDKDLSRWQYLSPNCTEIAENQNQMNEHDDYIPYEQLNREFK